MLAECAARGKSVPLKQFRELAPSVCHQVMVTAMTPVPGEVSCANTPRSRSMMRPAPKGPRSVTTQVAVAPLLA